MYRLAVFDDVFNKLSNTIINGEYDTWEDMCVEYSFPSTPLSDYTLVIWGEINKKDEKYFSVSVHKNDKEGNPDEKIFSAFSDSFKFEDFKVALDQAFDKLNMIVAPEQKKPLTEQIQEAAGSNSSDKCLVPGKDYDSHKFR